MTYFNIIKLEKKLIFQFFLILKKIKMSGESSNFTSSLKRESTEAYEKFNKPCESVLIDFKNILKFHASLGYFDYTIYNNNYIRCQDYFKNHPDCKGLEWTKNRGLLFTPTTVSWK